MSATASTTLPHCPNQMPLAWQPLLSTALQSRGTTYWKQGLVTAMGAGPEPHTQRYIVSGTMDYEVLLRLQDPLRSRCNCPHASSVPVCKHMVAAWLHAHSPTPAPAATPSPALAPTAAAPRKTRTTKAEQQRQDAAANLDFLQTQSAAQLCAWIAAQCDRDAQLRQQLTLWRKQTLNTPNTPAQWRSFLVQAMPQRQHMYGRELQRWADAALQALQPLAQLLPTQPGSIRSACCIALMRLFKVMETADDSYGQLHELYEWLNDLLVQSVQAEAPPASWLKEWMALIEADPLGWNHEEVILAHASEALRQAYIRHAEQAWQAWCEKHPPRPQGASRNRALKDDGHDRCSSYQRSQLRQRYLRVRSYELDIGGHIQLMQQTAHSERDWSEAVAFCETHQRHREALACAQLGLQHHPKSISLTKQLLHCYQRDGWDEEAMQLAQQSLDRQPFDLQHLEDALQCAITLGHSREQALQAQIERYIARQSSLLQKVPRTLSGLDVGAPIQWLMAEGQYTQALALLDLPKATCAEYTLYSLAQLLPAEHHPRAVAMMRPMLERAMHRASSPYHKELALVQHILARMPTPDRSHWLALLRTQYRQKTNFIKGLAALRP